MNGYTNYLLHTLPFNLINLKKLFSSGFRKYSTTKELKFIGEPELNKKQFKKLLWLDDRINPLEKRMDWLAYSPVGRDVKVVWVKNILDFKNWILNNGLPDAICFDYDLEDKNNGYDCAKWLIQYCQSKKLALPLWSSQSTNPEGKARINRLLKNFISSF